MRKGCVPIATTNTEDKKSLGNVRTINSMLVDYAKIAILIGTIT